MKVTTRNADAFSKSPAAEVHVVLVHGRDAGLIHERVKNLGLSVVPDLQDPFQVSELTGSAIKSDPACLADEATALSLTGGRRVVLVRLGGEDISAALKQVLEMPNMESLVVLEAGDLAASSPVRKLLEKHEHGASLACYEDSGASLASLVSEMSQAAGIMFSQDALDYTIAHLGSDRLVSRREIEKLIIYAGDKSEVSLEDASAVIGDNGALSIEEIIYAAGNGNRQALETGLSRAAAEGISPIALVRAAQRHFQRLHFAAAACGKGKTPREAVKSVQPPVLFMFEERFQRQLGIWTEPRLATALQHLTESESQCKSTGVPDKAIGERVLLRLAQVARAR
ncbi:MAG: DNA polymerase III subunit delta [Rhodospirillaceae bacterium TMED167]|nr:DNA polymerase III subunit delta [Rhodospirillaceae bacterium]OUW28615.1 MAG: DNA polymerase III subunit delta [Rhodospirillaceae bacterium TMED167]